MAVTARKNARTSAGKVYRPLFLDRTGDLRPSVERELTSISDAFLLTEGYFKNFPRDADGFYIYPSGGGGGPGAGVSSFKGRTGAVVPQLGDYTASMVTGAITISDLAGYVSITAVQSITGDKTFTKPVVVADAVTPTQAINKKQLDAAIATVSGNNRVVIDSFVGAVQWFNGDRTNLPDTYILADGQLLNRVDHAELWAEVNSGKLNSVADADWLNGTPAPHDPLFNAQHRAKYSKGDGSTTFRVPDLNGAQSGSWGHVYLSALNPNSVNNEGTVLGSSAPDIRGQFTSTVDGKFHLPTGSFDNAFSALSTVDTNVLSALNPDSLAILGAHARGAQFAASGSNGIYGRYNNTTEINPNTAFGVWIIKEKSVSVPGVEVHVLKNFVGAVEWFNGKSDRSTIPSDYIPSDGTLLSRAAFPELWKQVEDGVFEVVSDALWVASGVAGTPAMNRGKYSTGNGSTTFRVPDLNGFQSGSIVGTFLRGKGAGTVSVGSIFENSVPNLTGSMTFHGAGSATVMNGLSSNGVFVGSGVHQTSYRSADLVSGASSWDGVAFNANNNNKAYGRDASGQVTPNNAVGIWIIRAKGSQSTISDMSTFATKTDVAAVQTDLNTTKTTVANLIKYDTWLPFTDATVRQYFSLPVSTVAPVNVTDDELWFKFGYNSIQIKGNIHMAGTGATDTSKTLYNLIKVLPGFTKVSKTYGQVVLEQYHIQADVINNKISTVSNGALTNKIATTTFTTTIPITLFGSQVTWGSSKYFVIDELFVFSN